MPCDNFLKSLLLVFANQMKASAITDYTTSKSFLKNSQNCTIAHLFGLFIILSAPEFPAASSHGAT